MAHAMPFDQRVTQMRDAAREADREAFRAAVLDWRKKDGPLIVERFGRPVEKDK